MASVIELADVHMSGEIVWGSRDCVTGACDIFHDLHGVDPMREHRGCYSDKWGAYRWINHFGGWALMTDMVFGVAGLVEGDGSRGEIGLTVTGCANLARGKSLAVSAGDIGWITRTQMGYAVIKSDFIERSWKWQK